MSRNRIRVFPIWCVLSAIWMIVAIAEQVPREIWLVPPLLFGGGLSLLRRITDQKLNVTAKDHPNADGQVTQNGQSVQDLAVKYRRDSGSKSP